MLPSTRCVRVSVTPNVLRLARGPDRSLARTFNSLHVQKDDLLHVPVLLFQGGDNRAFGFGGRRHRTRTGLEIRSALRAKLVFHLYRDRHFLVPFS
jgi:hypothetical protein